MFTNRLRLRVCNHCQIFWRTQKNSQTPLNNLPLASGCIHERPSLTFVNAPAQFFGFDARKIAKSAQSLFRAANPAEMRVKPRPSRHKRAWLHPRDFGGSTPPKSPRFRRNPDSSAYHRRKSPKNSVKHSRACLTEFSGIFLQFSQKTLDKADFLCYTVYVVYIQYYRGDKWILF